MNIFYLHEDPTIAAQMLHDKHVVKMVLETTQILSSVRHRYKAEAPYKPTHANHPSVLWAGDHVLHYEWLWAHGMALAAEYTHRYGRTHACQTLLEGLRAVPHRVSMCPYAPPPQCVPEQFKQADTVQAYRQYYLAEKVKQSRWTYRDVPAFIKEIEMAKPVGKIVTPPVALAADVPAKDKAVVSRGPKGVEVTATITMLVSANPKRAGSQAHGRFEFYKTGMTVDAALAAGLTTPDLIYDASHGFISIAGYEAKLVPVKAPKAPKEPKPAKEAKAGTPPAAKPASTETLE